MKRLVVSALALVLWPAAVYAVCSPVAERPPAINTPDYVYLVPDSNMAPFTTAAQAAWAGCVSNNRPGFPFPTQTPLWNTYWSQLNVEYHSGFNPDNFHTCGSTTGQTINVYQSAWKPGTTITRRMQLLRLRPDHRARAGALLWPRGPREPAGLH
jgi:hypothetical protein